MKAEIKTSSKALDAILYKFRPLPLPALLLFGFASFLLPLRGTLGRKTLTGFITMTFSPVSVRKHLLISLLLAAGLYGTCVADTLTLPEVIQIAQERSLPAYRAKADQIQAQMVYRSFRASLLPQLSLDGMVPNYTNSFLETVQPDGSIAFQRISYNNASAG
ncbi:MAG: hypothetical protein AAFQ68_00950, partial [Bacteroidota bacterium]